MDLQHFHALRSGVVETDEGPRTLTVQPLGVLRLPSGRLEVSDSLVNLGEGVLVDVPGGDHPVAMTLADVSDAQDGSHVRVAYLSLVLSEGEPAVVERAAARDVPVDAGVVGFVDAESVERGMPEDRSTWYDEVFDGWIELLHYPDDGVHRDGIDVVLPRATAGENVVLSSAGWGDGVYRVWRTLAADGSLLGVHVDLDVVDVQDDEPAPPAASPEEPEPATGGFLRRLFRR